MLKRFLSRGVEVDLGNGATRFRSRRELELALGDKVGVSPLKVAALGGLNGAALRREEDELNAMAGRVVRALSQPPGASDDVDGFLRELDLALVSEDNGWRAVLATAKRMAPGGIEFKRAILRKYADYLSSGRELVRAMRDQPGNGLAAAGDAVPAPEDLGPRQSLVFDPADLAGEPADARRPEEFNRLPKGEPLAVDIAAHQSLTVLLAKYRFVLVGGATALLVDDNGNDYRLRPGRNIVGRSARCDVPIDPIYRALSRKHVIVESGQGNTMSLTDISTLGTFVPREYLDNRLH